MKKTVRIAYLVSHYPAISHTFILREIGGLRNRGVDIVTASINDTDRPMEQMTSKEQEEAGKTFYVKRQGLHGAAQSHLAFFFRQPLSYLKGLIYVSRLGGINPAGVIYHFFYFTEALIIIRWMQRQQARHLHVHFATQAATVALIISRISPITFSITVHGPTEFYEVSNFHLPEKIKRASWIFCISKYAKSQLMLMSDRSFWDKLELSPLGVDTDVFVPQSNRMNDLRFQIVFVGRFARQKAHPLLVEAVDRLVKEGRDVRLCLVGDGPERSSVEKDVEDRGLSQRVVFEGAVNQDHIRTLYAASDLFALPSFAEGLPVVLMEAMAMGVPCIATAIAGIPELIRNRVDGILVPPSDAEAMAKTIAELMDDDKLRSRLGKAGRQRILEAYDFNQSIDRLVDIFRRRLDDTHKS